MRARHLAGVLLLLWSSAVRAGVEDDAISIWEAANRLGIAGPEILPAGWFAELGTVTREAVAGEWESETTLGVAGEGRPGGGIAWRRFWSARETRADITTLFAGFHRGDVWGNAGWSLSRRGSHRASRIAIQGACRPVPALLVGAEARLSPGMPGAAPDLRFWSVASRGPGMAGLRLGPDPENYLLSLGVRLDAHLIWSARVSDLRPALGISWRLGALLLYAESERHPFLGAVTRFRIRWGGR